MFNPNQAFLLVQKLEFVAPPKGFYTLGAKAEIEKKKKFQSAPSY